MKKIFTKEYMLSNRGCYSRDKMLSVKCVSNKTITLKQLFRDLPIRDFTWFLVKKCDLTLVEKRRLALRCAKQVLPIYEEKYPKDKRIRECIEATELYLDDKITLNELRKKRAYPDTAAAAAAAYAYATAAYAYAYAAAAAAAAADAADTDTAAAAAYRESIWNFIKTELL